MKPILLTFFTAIVLTSCAPTLTPFSQSLYERNNWSDQDLRKIQFYLSEDIVLRRKAESNESAIDGGKIRMIDGEEIEEVIFKKGTPGVYVFSPKENRFGVSFESEGDGFLMFGPNPKMGHKYVLLGKEWDRNSGLITYNNRTYQTPTECSFAALMVDLKKASKVRYSKKTVEGRRVD